MTQANNSTTGIEQSCDNLECDRTHPKGENWNLRAGHKNVKFCSSDCLLDYFNNQHPSRSSGKTDEQIEREGEALANIFHTLQPEDERPEQNNSEQ